MASRERQLNANTFNPPCINPVPNPSALFMIYYNIYLHIHPFSHSHPSGPPSAIFLPPPTASP